MAVDYRRLKLMHVQHYYGVNEDRTEGDGDEIAILENKNQID